MVEKLVTQRVYQHVVICSEHERGWGSKDITAQDFDTETEARAHARQVNSVNTEPIAPDYYIRARYVHELDAETFERIRGS